MSMVHTDHSLSTTAWHCRYSTDRFCGQIQASIPLFSHTIKVPVIILKRVNQISASKSLKRHWWRYKIQTIKQAQCPKLLKIFRNDLKIKPSEKPKIVLTILKPCQKGLNPLVDACSKSAELNDICYFISSFFTV